MIIQKRFLMQATLLLVLIAIIYEFPASIAMEVWYSFGVMDSDAFIRFRLLFAAVVILVCAANVVINMPGIFLVREFWVYLLALSIMAIIVWINRNEIGYVGLREAYSLTALDFWAPLLFKYILFFFIGLHLAFLRAYSTILALFLLLTGALVLQYVDLRVLGLDRRNYIDGAYQGNYLFLGDSFAIAALLILAFLKTAMFRLAFFVCSAGVLFLIGSRTSFAVFVFVVSLYYLLVFRVKWIPVYFLLCAGVVAALTQVDFDELADINPRMIKIFQEFEEDGSVIGRRALAEIGWADIYENPLLGRFGAQRDISELGAANDWNSYMHNVFSYWRQFGILVIAALGFIYLRYVYQLLKLTHHKNTPAFRMYFLLGAFVMIESIFSRSFAFAPIHLIFGMAVMLCGRSIIGSAASALAYGSSAAYQDDMIKPKSRRRRRRRSSKKDF